MCNNCEANRKKFQLKMPSENCRASPKCKEVNYRNSLAAHFHESSLLLFPFIEKPPNNKHPWPSILQLILKRYHGPYLIRRSFFLTFFYCCTSFQDRNSSTIPLTSIWKFCYGEKSQSVPISLLTGCLLACREP